MTEDATRLYPTVGPAARRELLRRLNREDSNLYHVIGRIRDAEEAGAMTAEQAGKAIQAARADHEKWCAAIRQAWQRQQAQRETADEC